MGRSPERRRRWRFRADDGTRLAWYECGRSDGPPVVFLSGLGGGVGIFRPMVGRLGGHCRLIGWDYRGLYKSARPRRTDRLEMGQHVQDLLALLRHAELEAPILVGWSTDVFDSQRAGFASILVLLIAGMVVMLYVREVRAERAPEDQ